MIKSSTSKSISTKTNNSWNVQFDGSIRDSKLVANSFHARLKQVRNHVRNEDLRDCHRSQYIGIPKVSDCAASCRKVVEFDTSLLCETGTRTRTTTTTAGVSLQTERRCCCRRIFRVKFRYFPPGEKTSGNVLVKLTGLSSCARGAMFPSVDCEFLFDELFSFSRLRRYTVFLGDARVSRISVLKSFRAPGYFACESLGNYVFYAPK